MNKEPLSPNAHKLYQALKTHFEQKNLKHDWIRDDRLSRLSRILLKDLSAAQSELSRSQLMFLTPGVSSTRYSFTYDDIAAG